MHLKQPLAIFSICLSNRLSLAMASSVGLGAPGKAIIMILILSRLPCKRKYLKRKNNWLRQVEQINLIAKIGKQVSVGCTDLRTPSLWVVTICSHSEDVVLSWPNCAYSSRSMKSKWDRNKTNCCRLLCG